ncbi:MAG TPA: phage tail protein [Vicinamibacteria bacterium]|nr:phage tail protein [Vicinamibacteria bacterium]
MADINVQIDSKAVERALREAPKKVALAIYRSVRRGTQSAHTLSGRLVAREMGLKVGVAKKAIEATEPTFTNLEGQIRASRKPIPLIQFGAKGPRPSRGRGRGVTVRISGKTRRYARAFITTVGRHEGVFERRPGAGRLPIRELFGPSVGDVFRGKQNEILRHGAETVVKEMRRQIGNILGGIA